MTPETPFVPSANIARLRESATIAVSQRAKALKAAGRTIIDLGAGEPDFDTPAFIRAAAAAALEAGATRYTAVDGILPLRQAIADDANARYLGADRVTATDVVVSTGSKQTLYNACVCLFGPGDEVLVPTPAWTSYYEMVELARATAVEVLGNPSNGYKVSAAMLEAAATPRTKGVMLNSPSNPTGSVYSGEELRAILDVARARGWYVLSDEIYQRIAYGTPALSALDVATSRDRLVVINGVAKAYAMTGWRIGWSVSSGAVAKAMTAFQSHTTSNAATVSQHAALAALTRRDESNAAIATMVAAFHTRRDAAIAILREEPRIELLDPAGAFYLFLRAPLDRTGRRDGDAFCARLLDEAGLAIVPGSAFRTPEWVRISYAADQAEVERAMHLFVGCYRAVLEESGGG
jgi:aspartate aminotransferase